MARSAGWLTGSLLLVLGSSSPVNPAWALDVAWMQPGVRVWYLGAVDGGGVTSSNAAEAYLVDAVDGANVRLTHHSALDHWSSPRPVETGPYPRLGKGPSWIHPTVLETLSAGDDWLGQEITLVIRSTYDYDSFPYRFLPARALFDLRPQREIVKLSYLMPGFSVGNAYFDADTGLLLYYQVLWGAYRMFFILSEINYDFATRTAFAEDRGPHTGFKSFVSEQSLGNPMFVGGGSVIIQSLVESRHGATVEMRVLTSISASGLTLEDENYCFFGDVPILRRLDATQAPNVPPDQWDPRGAYLWWWIPPTALEHSTIDVFEVPMTRTSTHPYTFTATADPGRFFFSRLWFDADGYLTAFAAKDAQTGLDLDPGDVAFQNLTTVNGLDYYRNAMGMASPGSPPLIADVRANGSDTPVTVFPGQFLRVTVSLDNRGRSEAVDWWLAASTPVGFYFFTFAGWTTTMQPAYQGPLFLLGSLEVLNLPASALPAGTSTLYFGVDDVVDGALTMDGLYFDSVPVTVAQ